MSMACSLKTSFIASWSNETLVKHGSIELCPSRCSLKFSDSHSKDFMGKSIHVSSDQKGFSNWNVKAPLNFSVHAQTSICVSRGLRWWEETLEPNMVEIHLGQELIDSLSNAGDRLVIVNFYSPGCGGCKALHGKICQLAESNPNAIFLKVNYEKLKIMCHALHIHVLPFFRFYRGAEGRLCSFSCTNATIKKFKDALSKYGTGGCSFGPAKGLDDTELLKLASIGQFLPPSKEYSMENLVLKGMDLSLGNKIGLKEKNSFIDGLNVVDPTLFYCIRKN